MNLYEESIEKQTKTMNIPRELFTDLTDMVYVQNCNLIRRICSDLEWNADAMIADLLDKTILIDEGEFVLSSDEEGGDNGIIAKPMTESEMEARYAKSNSVVPSEMLHQFMNDELICKQESVTINKKKYNVYELNNGISGLLIMWNEQFCIWDRAESKIYSFQSGDVEEVATCSLSLEEMAKHIVDF